jgi:hypothetical protein
MTSATNRMSMIEVTEISRMRLRLCSIRGPFAQGNLRVSPF